MTFNPEVMTLANHLRYRAQQKTKLIDHAESAAMVLWWSFLLDHAAHTGMPIDQLAREQLEAFIEFAKTHGVQLVKTH